MLASRVVLGYKLLVSGLICVETAFNQTAEMRTYRSFHSLLLLTISISIGPL